MVLDSILFICIKKFTPTLIGYHKNTGISIEKWAFLPRLWGKAHRAWSGEHGAEGKGQMAEGPLRPGEIVSEFHGASLRSAALEVKGKGHGAGTADRLPSVLPYFV